MNEKQMTITTFIILGVVIVLVLIFAFNPSALGIVQKDRLYQVKYFDPDTVNTLNILIDEYNWQDILNNPLKKEYHECNIVLNGNRYEKIGIRTKGQATLSRTAKKDYSNRYSFKFKADYIDDDKTFSGLKEFTINTGDIDPTSMRDYLELDILSEMGVPTPLFSYVAVYLNGEYWGLYLMTESIEEDFLIRNFGSNYGNLYKSYGANLVYVDDNISKYKNIFNNVKVKKELDDSEKKVVIDAIKHINTGTDIEKYVDVSEVLKYAAVNVAVLNYDSYIKDKGVTNNYYLYESGGRLSLIPWDCDCAFAGWWEQNRVIPGLSKFEGAINYPINNIKYDSNRPIISSLLTNKESYDEYLSYLKTISEDYLGQKLSDKIDSIDNLIDEYVKNDSTSLFTYEKYKSGISTLKKFGVGRAKSILGQINGDIPSTFEDQVKNPTNLIRNG